MNPDQIVICYKCFDCHQIRERLQVIEGGMKLPLNCCPRCECKFVFPILQERQP